MFSARTLSLLVGTIAALTVIPAVSAETPASVTIEQVSASDYGTWTLLSANGTSRVSTDLTTDPRRYATTIADFGQMILGVQPPSGMQTRISVYQGGFQIGTVDGRQHAFTLNPSESYRFVIQYYIGATGTMGVISDPQGVIFRVKADNGRTYRGKTPWAFTELPIGKYTIYANGNDTCFRPAPKNVQLKPEQRLTVELSLTCEGAEDSFYTVERVRPSKRSILDAVKVREAMRKTRHLLNQ